MSSQSRTVFDSFSSVGQALRVWRYGLTIALLSFNAYAVDCGDVIGPRGFVVLDSDLVCSDSPALIIKGPVNVDLNGATISCSLPMDEDFPSIGIDVLGRRARIQNGIIENCARGVVVEGDGRHVLRKLTVTSPIAESDDGLFDQGIAFQVKSTRNRFIDNSVTEYAGEGFRLGDEDVPANHNLLVHNVARDNRNHAFRVRFGERNLFLRNRAIDNVGRIDKVQGEGFRSEGRGNKFIANTAIGNGDEGFRIKGGENNLLIRNVAKNNGRIPCNPSPPKPDVNPGIAITDQGTKNKIINNTTISNCVGIGVEFGSLGNKIVNNRALDSLLIDLADGNPNCDLNKWIRNDFAISAAGADFSDVFPECIN